jgi:hypothetical protein
MTVSSIAIHYRGRASFLADTVFSARDIIIVYQMLFTLIVEQRYRYCVIIPKRFFTFLQLKGTVSRDFRPSVFSSNNPP